MKTGSRAGASTFGALILSGCAASLTQGAQVRARPTPGALERNAASDAALSVRLSETARDESPLARACKDGRSKSCNEIGDRLVIKHAYAEARPWYVTSCDRARSAMVPTATRLLQLSEELVQLEKTRLDEEYAAAAQKRMVALKSAASEIRARLQGCFDAGETFKVDGELKQSLGYYDAVCEFSALVTAAGEALPDLEHITENGCTASQAARAKLSASTPFSPQLFADLLQQQRQPVAAKQHAAQPEAGMVFSEGEL